ncbi:MAG: hypothetical protein HY509_05400, partial [Acidobacteria bacterium]|nr:hypothetical protein [Acidobacteriota bacterium]
MLRGLRRPDVSGDLRERLIRTIPPGYRSVPRRRLLQGGRLMKPLLATGLTLFVAAMSVLLFGPSDTVGPAYALGPVAETLAR